MSIHHSSFIIHHSPRWKWYVCGALLLATMLNYMDRQALAQTATELKRLYNLHDARYGQVEQWFSYAFGFGSVFFGLLADRFGPRWVYPLVLAGWSAAGIVTPFAADASATAWLDAPGAEPGEGAFRWLLGCRAALGFFEAGHWPCALITARQILSAADRPFGNGLLQSGATTGALLILLYMMVLRSLAAGWEVVFWTVGAVGLLWVPAWFALVRRGDLDGPPPPPASGEVAAAGPIDVVGFLRRVVVLVVVVTCLGVSWQFLRAWLPKYLKEYHHYSDTLADWAVIGYYVAADLGCILAGFAVKWLAGRGWAVHPARVLAFAGWAGLTALAAAVPFLGGSPWVLLPVLMLVGAGILGLHPVYYALAQELPAKHMGVLSGGLAAVTWVTVGTAQGAIGAHIKATGSYDVGLVVAGLAPLLGLAVLVLLWRAPPAARVE